MSGNVAAVDFDIAAPALTAAADTRAAVGIRGAAGRVNFTAVDIDMSAVTLKAAADTRRVNVRFCVHFTAVDVDVSTVFAAVAADTCIVVGVGKRFKRLRFIPLTVDIQRIARAHMNTIFKFNVRAAFFTNNDIDGSVDIHSFIKLDPVL